MAHVMMTETGQQIQNEEVAEADLPDYAAGGVILDTDLGRVDTANGSISNSDYIATVTPDGAGDVTLELYAVADGTEHADGAITGDVTFTATRQ